MCAPVRCEAQDDFENLKKIGIFHTNPQKASEFLNDTYRNIDTWWNSNQLQSVLNIFRNKYCKYDPNYINNLAILINKLLK